MSLASYLAKNYLSEDKKPKKKKKKTEDSLVVESEDVLGWENTKYKEGGIDEDDEGEIDNQPQSTTHKKPKGWKKLTGESTSELKLKSPVNITPIDDSNTPLMSDGSKAGLQTGKQVREALERRQKEDLKRFLENDDELARKNSQTVYRDASGRIINIEEVQSKAKEETIEKKEKEAKLKERQLGLVQKKQEEDIRKELKSSISINRYANDEQLNKELKSQYRFNDPAARFSKNVKEQKQKGEMKTNTSYTGLPIYKGGYNPNRFNIAPGIKWDGVDRSNGFESIYFKKQNERKEKKILSYTRAFDD